MTRKIDSPKIVETVSGFKVSGRKYKAHLVERGIFNPELVTLYVSHDDQPTLSKGATKTNLGIHRAITKQLRHEEYIWIFDTNTNYLKDDIAFLTIEMSALRVMNRDMRL